MLSRGNRDVQHKTNAKHQQLLHPQMSSEHSTEGLPGPALPFVPPPCRPCWLQAPPPLSRLQNQGPGHPTRPVPCAPRSAQPHHSGAGAEHPSPGLVLGFVLCCVVCVHCVCARIPGGGGGSSGPPELPGDAVLVFGPAALCWVPCQNGGSCAFPGRCACPPGWMGRTCQTGTGCTAPLRAP